jgi:O-antigen/teichoic acid export membrane protein
LIICLRTGERLPGLTPYVVAMGGTAPVLPQQSSAALNIALGVTLVPRIGISGAAIAVLVSATAFQVALTIEAWILERVHPFTMALVKPMAAALVAVAVESTLHAFVRGGAARVGLVLAGGLASYLAVLLALGLAAQERDLLRKLTARLRPPRS